MDAQLHVAHSYGALPLRNQKEETTNTCNKTDESQRHYVEQNKSDTKDDIQLDSMSKLRIHRNRRKESVGFNSACQQPLREKVVDWAGALKVSTSVVVTRVHADVKIHQAVQLRSVRSPIGKSYLLKSVCWRGTVQLSWAQLFHPNLAEKSQWPGWASGAAPFRGSPREMDSPWVAALTQETQGTGKRWSRQKEDTPGGPCKENQ